MGPRPEVFAKKGPEAGKYSQKKMRSQLGILHNTGNIINNNDKKNERVAEGRRQKMKKGV